METLTDNAAMLYFPKIGEIFKDKIVKENLWQEVKRKEIQITDVRLGLMRVLEQNNPKRGILIPVWDFFGTDTEYTEQDGKQYINTNNDATRSLLTINAIDGSIIDRDKGY